MGIFDISRFNFNAAKHYSTVRMQQGRVLTDDDWNENERIEDDDERSSRVHIIGPYGSPDDGFKIEPIVVPPLPDLIDGNKINFLIKAGTIYLGGLRLELEADETYRLQKDWLQQPSTLDGTPVFDQRERFDLVYLEAWQQGVSAVEDSSLFEEALGGPDTTTRIRNMRRVHLEPGVGTSICAEAWAKLVTKWSTTDHLGLINYSYQRVPNTKLTVSFANNGLPEDLCTPAAAGGYLGAENQAIRVQIVDSTHFTWGYDNASPLYRVILVEGRTTIKMLTDPKDQYHWPVSRQVIEILPWSAVLSNGEKVAEEKGHLTKVLASYDPDNSTFTIADALPANFGEEWKNRADKDDLDNQVPPEYFYMRVWNRGSDLDSVAALPIVAGKIPLTNTGLEIEFTGTDKVSNDYWVIAARPGDPAKPNKVVPWELEKGVSSHGVNRFFAPLAVIRWIHNPAGNVVGMVVQDCRKPFKPLTNLNCKSCSIVIEPKPGWETVFERLNNDNKIEDIQVCFKPGIFPLSKPIELRNKRTIKFTGCGEGSRITISGSETALLIEGCLEVIIRDLNFKSLDLDSTHKTHLSGIISLHDCGDILLENIGLTCAKNPGAFKKEATCVTIKNVDPRNELRKSVFIQNSDFGIQNGQTGILIINVEDVFIQNNRIRGLSRGSQGIVVGGKFAQNIQIIDNHIDYVLEAIHVGVSRNRTEDGRDDPATYFAESITISGNKIGILLPRNLKSTQGIFVGNFDHSLIINENVIDVIGDPEDPFDGIANGIRVHGLLGKIAILRNNYAIFPKFKRGIQVTYLGDPAILRNEKVIWIAEQNYARVRVTGQPPNKFKVRDNI